MTEKLCPICGQVMREEHRHAPPTMRGGPVRIFAKRWVCAQGDGKGGGHIVEISERCDDYPVLKVEDR
jgi:hypothetical protein